MRENHEKLTAALEQWRDSLINLTGRNRLLNYRPTRASTIEFSGLSPTEVHTQIASKGGAYTVGTRPQPPRSVESADVEASALEDDVLLELAAFDYEEYPNHLFADKTQREVDRTLKRLSANAKREFIEKGISTLYAAFGALRWVDDAGDARTSPLILVPVVLESEGPRQPLRLTLSADEPSNNPALALKLLEYGITLPSADQVEEAMSRGGLSDAVGLFSSVDFPDGWVIQDFAVLSTFMFAKEAMYRDLLENEQVILDHPVLQSLAGLVPEPGKEFVFDAITAGDIDSAAPPELTPLVLDADSSQREVIAAALAGKSFVLNGPPGTGKSQTISNIIAALIEADKKVLFVSEKAVALDVVRDRLSARGLDAFLLELHSHKAVRSEVAARLGRSLDMTPISPAALDPLSVQRAKDMRVALNGYSEAMNEVRQPLGMSVHEVLGKMSAFPETPLAPKPNVSVGSFDRSLLASLTDQAQKLARNWTTALEGRDSLWWGLQESRSLEFDIQQAVDALSVYRRVFDDVAPVADALDLRGMSDGRTVDEILDVWHAGPPDKGDVWLHRHSSTELGDAVLACEQLVTLRQVAVAAAAEDGGPRWEQLPVLESENVPSTPVGLRDWALGIDKLPAQRLPILMDFLVEASAAAVAIEHQLGELSQELGLTRPRTLAESRVFVRVCDAILSESPPRADWLTAGRLETAESDAAALKSAFSAETTAAHTAQAVFTDDVLNIDVRPLADRFAKNASFLRRFSREFKADRAELVRVSKVDWKESVGALVCAERWIEARARLAALQSESAEDLGPYFPHGPTDWTRLDVALANARTIVASGIARDVALIGEYVVDHPAKNLLRTVLAELKDSLNEWPGLVSANGLGLPATVVLSPFTDAVSYSASRQAELQTLIVLQTTIREAVGSDMDLDQSRIALRSRTHAHHVNHETTAGLRDLEPIVGMWPQGDWPADAETVGRLKTRLEWVLAVRRVCALGSGTGTMDAAPPLSEKQFKGLSTSYGPSALRKFGDDWYRSLTAVTSRFSAERQTQLGEDLSDFESARRLLNDLVSDVDGPTSWFDASAAQSALATLGFGSGMDYALSHQLPAESLVAFLSKSAFEKWVDYHLNEDTRLHRFQGMDRSEVVENYRQLDRALVDGAVSTIITSVVARRPRANYGQASIIRREAEKKKRHIPVRQLVDRARDVIQAIHPCFMMSPLAVSQYLPADLHFDVVIFDEASQVTPGDAINCIYRGDALIAAGDQRQLPPMSFFATSAAEDADSDEENLATDYESILDLMKSAGHFNALTLRWHYRSRHEHLIAYSNASFYDGKLVTFPGAVATSRDMGVKYVHVDGVYRRSAGQDNPIEAQEVAKRVLHHFETRPNLSLGVVAFSAAQRDTLENALEIARADRPELDRFFEESRQDGFFIKSLEFVQGDERDVIIFSIGYGPDEAGKIYKNFGALNRQGGERRLNVAITRARQLVEVVTSMSAAQMGDVGSEGARHLRRYLDFAERGPAALSLELGDEGRGTDSPFEDSVIDAIRSWGYEVQPQVGVSGYRIDIGVKHPNAPGAFMLGVECDGAMYHSSRSARDRDRLRHEVLEGLGWRIHHIWGTGWYRNREREHAKLRTLLDELALQPLSGRTGAAKTKGRTAPVEVQFADTVIDEAPTWAIPYSNATPARIPRWVDLSDARYAPRLVDFVREVAIAESPVHIETLSARLRDAAGVGRVGSRMRNTLIQAIRVSKITFDGNFVSVGDMTEVRVRMPSDGTTRAIEYVADSELMEAIRRVVQDAGGAPRAETIGRVCRLFGWQRQTSGIAFRLGALVDALIVSNDIEETGAGLRMP